MIQSGVPASMSDLATFEQNAGKKVAIINFWQYWAGSNSAVNVTLLQNAANHGSVPMITWVPRALDGSNPNWYDLGTIRAGGQDSYIRSSAQALKTYGGPVLLRFAHEMNGNWYPWGDEPQLYITAWKHVHDIFTSAGATNVKWVWSPNVEDAWTPLSMLAQYYPGDAYVDWVALDGYNKGSSGYGWQTWNQIYTASYRDITSLTSKPLMIAEVSSNEATLAQAAVGLSKASWIRDALTVGVPSMPRIKALIWMNDNLISTEGCCDWRIQSSYAAEMAFRQTVSSSLYLSY